ncbi:MAG: chemotaxis protein CheW [Scytolyngbya sp. HA4215-MV1]|jgi:chemotaxis signal transduction protein|nr:chemotaxis protein CheW [Scytolyngbya sp. HA4215-MV1]
MKKLQTRTPTLKVLVIPVQNLSLALKLEGVQKVVPTPQIFKSGEKTLGVAHFEDREAIVVDLHHKIFGAPSSQPERYVVLVQATDQQLYGIPTTTLPTLQELPLESLNPLPADYRDRDTLGIASHTVALPQQDTEQTLFLLDPDRLFV